MSSMQFDIISEATPGDKFSQLFNDNWPTYRAWYLDEGEAARPSYLDCITAFEQHMPELFPLYQQLEKLLDCDDLQARFLSLWCPPTFYSGCSQLIYKGYPSALIRNYDFPAFLCEGTILYSQWLDKRVIAMADCVWGALDGINDAGLSVSINYGGHLIEGEGFGITIVVRYVLETCSSVAEAVAAFERIPVHLDYNIALLDKDGNHATVLIAPDKAALVTQATTSTNHQGPLKIDTPLLLKDSGIRLEALDWLAANSHATLPQAVAEFLSPPLYRPHSRYQSATLYTAVYNPAAGCVSYVWPNQRLDLTFDQFIEQELAIEYV